jgi:hypothetical protein
MLSGVIDPSPTPGATPGTGPGPGVAGLPASGAPHAPTGGRRFPTAVVLAVVVGAVAFAAGLFSSGPLLHASSGSSASHAPLTYNQAKSLSDTLVGGVRGGTWEEVAAIGIVSHFGEEVSSPSGDSCPSPAFYIPAFTGSISAGTASLWLLEYLLGPTQVSPGEILTAVENGTATILTYLPPGSDCSQSAEGTPALTGTVVDSSTAIASAYSDGGEGFLESQPNSTLVYELETGAPNNWTVEFDPCSLVGGVTSESGTHPSLTVTMPASTGTVATTVTGSTTCVSSVPYDISLTQGAAGTLTSGADYDNFTVVMGAPLPLPNLAIWIQTSSAQPVYGAEDGCNNALLAGCPQPAYGWYVTLSVGTTVEATYPTPFGSSTPAWYELVGGTVSNIQNGEILTVVSNGPLLLSGDTLALLGLSGATITSDTTL